MASNEAVGLTQERHRELVLRHSAELRAHLRRLLGNEQNVTDDILQMTFLSAWTSRHQFPGGDPQARAWLFRTARRKAIDHFRACAVRWVNNPVVSESLLNAGARRAGVEEADCTEQLDRKLQLEELRRSLETLDDVDRVIVETSFELRPVPAWVASDGGVTYAEIGVLLEEMFGVQLSEDAVRMRLKRALNSLHLQLFPKKKHFAGTNRCGLETGRRVVR